MTDLQMQNHELRSNRCRFHAIVWKDLEGTIVSNIIIIIIVIVMVLIYIYCFALQPSVMFVLSLGLTHIFSTYKTCGICVLRRKDHPVRCSPRDHRLQVRWSMGFWLMVPLKISDSQNSQGLVVGWWSRRFLGDGCFFPWCCLARGFWLVQAQPSLGGSMQQSVRSQAACERQWKFHLFESKNVLSRWDWYV